MFDLDSEAQNPQWSFSVCLCVCVSVCMCPRWYSIWPAPALWSNMTATTWSGDTEQRAFLNEPGTSSHQLTTRDKRPIHKIINTDHKWVTTSEWPQVNDRVLRPTWHIIGHFRDKCWSQSRATGNSYQGTPGNSREYGFHKMPALQKFLGFFSRVLI